MLQFQEFLLELADVRDRRRVSAFQIGNVLVDLFQEGGMQSGLIFLVQHSRSEVGKAVYWDRDVFFRIGVVLNGR